jgi:demethylmenaquinone methyltransferase/2-methoxy-6-polyprenyl-1,4-benzoquinol methylase
MYRHSAPETIQAMFASIAPNYDRANLFSFGFHKKWNRRLIEAMGDTRSLLDLCAGTGEISFGFLKNNPESEAILLDFCPEMLSVAQKKGAPFHNRFEIVQADAQAIPLSNESVDGVSIAYGIRNVHEPIKCFQEVYRVLTPQGRFGILELTRPSSFFLRKAHALYTHLVLPTFGKMITKNGEAYRYLVDSVKTFPSPEVLEKLLQEIGFAKIQKYSLSGGIATLITATKHSVYVPNRQHDQKS